MIIDSLQNLKNYESVNPLFSKVIEFLKSHDLKTLEVGKYEIEGKDLFVNITMTKGKTPDEAVIETHDKMIDIQIPITDTETFGYTPRENLPAATYNAEKDITKIPDLAAEHDMDRRRRGDKRCELSTQRPAGDTHIQGTARRRRHRGCRARHRRGADKSRYEHGLRPKWPTSEHRRPRSSDVAQGYLYH